MERRRLAAGYATGTACAKITCVQGKYTIELFHDGGERAGIERILVQHYSLATSRALYKAAVKNNPDRLVVLCDRSHILARSDQPEITPPTAPAVKS